MKKYCIGIDLGGTTTKFGLFDLDGNLHQRWQISTDTSESGKYILENIMKSLKNTLLDSQVKDSQVEGIGIGVPGLATGDGHVTIAANLGWSNVKVADKLRELSGMPVLVSNDANVAAMGEMWKGSGKDHKNLVMITIGTGIGAGIIIDEQIVNGLFGGGGEIGHMPIVYDETTFCGCGRKGCLEQAASATGMIKTAKSYLRESKEESALTYIEPITLPAIFEAAKSGDPIATRVVERAGRFLGLALATITCVLDPEVYIIGGGVSKAGQYFLDIIKKHYKENVMNVCSETKIIAAKLGNDAGIYGAARMVVVGSNT
jgi:glucokinase